MKTKKRFLSILLSLVLVLGLMPGMNATAYAQTEIYTKLKNDMTVVNFHDHVWYIIADDSSSATAGTVTLLAADNSFGTSKFDNNQSSNAYSSSTVKGVLDALTAEGGAFASVKDAIADTDLSDVNVTGAKLYLLSTSEAEPYANLNFTGAQNGIWWLRSPGSNSDKSAAFVYGQVGRVIGTGYHVGNSCGVRPALKLDLSSVIFSSESNSFTLKPAHTHSFSYSASGATITATCGATGCDITEGLTLAISAPTGDLTADGTTTFPATLNDDYNTTAFPGTYNVTYTKDGADFDGTPTAAGEYTASVTVGDATASVSYTVNAALTEPRFSETRLELGGILNLRFYVAYPENWDGANDRVEFDVNGVTHTVTYAESAVDTNGRYFPCPVDAFQMADLIDAAYYHGEDVLVSVEDYTVEQNLTYLNANTTGDTQALVRATMDFGSYIQPYLAAQNNWTVGADHVAMTPYNASLAALTSIGDQYKHTMTKSDSVKSVMFSLSTYQDNALNVKVALQSGVSGTISATVNGDAVTPASAGTNAYKLTLDQLPANALATAYPFTLSVDGTQVLSFTASALSYVKLVLPQTDDNAEKLALTALYNYAIAAQNYQSN